MKLLFVLVLAFCALAASSCKAQGWSVNQSPGGPYFPVSADQVARLASFKSGEPLVTTAFFYWYDQPSGEHWVLRDKDYLTDHPVDANGYSYKNTAWWKRHFEEVSEAGIDVVLLVWWGDPLHEDFAWSRAGLPHAVAAYRQLEREGKQPPRLGMFYDTSTLWRTPHDLNTAEGRDWMYVSLRDFWTYLPPDTWALVDGKPLVFLYAAVKPEFRSQEAVDLCYERFARDFSCEPYIVAEVSWAPMRFDSVYAWGGAVSARYQEVASIGPGFDSTAVPNGKLLREREGGKTYSDGWEGLLRMRPDRRSWMVMIETWNELHEATEISETVEYGRQYLDLTRNYTSLFKQGAQLPGSGDFEGARQVSLKLQGDKSEGITPASTADGAWELADYEGSQVIRMAQGSGPGHFLYFAVDDSFWFDGEGPIELVVEYWATPGVNLSLEYDSSDTAASHSGAYKLMVVETQREGWTTALFRLEDARFINRQNARADLRLSGGESLAVRALTLSKLKED